MKAILVERDYKGDLERFALTPSEFDDQFGAFMPGAPGAAISEPGSFTLRPMVHIWYQPTDVGSEAWEKFFTDMSWGLSEGDIRDNNLAYIRDDFMLSLKEYLPTHDVLAITQNDIDALHGSIHNLRKQLNGAAEFDPDMVPELDKQLLFREIQLEAAYNGLKVEQSRLEARWTACDELFEKAQAELAAKQNTTSCGEPQAYIALSNGRTVGITLEQEGLPENEQFFSARLYCSDSEIDDKSTLATGILQEFSSDDSSPEALKETIIMAVLCNEIYPTRDQQLLKVDLPEKDNPASEIDVANKINIAYEALSEALAAVDDINAASFTLHPAIGNRLYTAKTILSEVIAYVQNTQDITSNTSQFSSLDDKINSAAMRASESLAGNNKEQVKSCSVR